MKAHYGYKNGSGDFFIVIDTDRCDGCDDCVQACPQNVLELIENEFDIEGDKMVAVKDDHRKKLKYSCGPCKPVAHIKKIPCVQACKKEAITHSW